MKQKNLRKKSGTDWERLAIMPDKDIDLSDNPELDTSFFENAVLRMPEPKKLVSLRVDRDVLSWFKRQGKGYQTRMNAILRMYMDSRSSKFYKATSGSRKGTASTRNSKTLKRMRGRTA